MNDQSPEQDNRENLSGYELAECRYEHNRRILNEFESLTYAISGKQSNTAADVIST